MQISELIQLVESVSKSEVRQFIYKTNDEFLSINKAVETGQLDKTLIYANTIHPETATDSIAHDEYTPQAKTTQTVDVREEKSPVHAEKNEKLVDVTAPSVGTVIFNDSKTGYRYVELGDNVTKGQLLFVMESMKLFTDVIAPISGKIAQICVDNNQIVDFGTVILKVEGES